MDAITKRIVRKENGGMNCTVYLITTEAIPQIAETTVRARKALVLAGMSKV